MSRMLVIEVSLPSLQTDADEKSSTALFLSQSASAFTLAGSHYEAVELGFVLPASL